MSDFITDYLEHTKDYESPTSFWKWSAYSAIAAVLRDNCYRRQGDSRLYPSIFVLLLAASSYHRKGRPVELCESLVYKVQNTKIISGRASIQAILDELSYAETDKKTGKMIPTGSAIFFAPELSAGIVDDPAAIKILTDIYDFKMNPYTSRLRTAPKFKIDKIVLSMFAASNEDMIKDFYNSTAVQGGLLARTFLIIPNEFRPGNSLIRFVDRSASFDNLVTKLKEISELTGEFEFDEDALHEYENWYLPFRQSYMEKKEKTGVLGRIHTGAFKLSMLLAANECTMRVRKCHIEQAINECLALLPNYSVFSMSQGKSTIAEAGAIFLQELKAAPNNTMSRKDLMRLHWSSFDADLLDKLTQSLQQGGMLVVLTSPSNMEISYQLTQRCLETLKGGG